MAKLALTEAASDEQAPRTESEASEHVHATVAKKAPSRAPRAKRARASAQPKPKSAIKRATPTQKSLAQAPASSQLSTFAIGAGIGAVVTLSMLALRSKGSRNSNLGATLLKTAVYAVGRTSEPGSLTNVIARLVGSALA
jgi:hypothetical protein